MNYRTIFGGLLSMAFLLALLPSAQAQSSRRPAEKKEEAAPAEKEGILSIFKKKDASQEEDGRQRTADELKDRHQDAKAEVRATKKERKAAEAREEAARARAEAIKAQRRAVRADDRVEKAEKRADKAREKAGRN